MNREELVRSSNFKVVCSRCGVIIKRNSAKESRGMCLKCYARMPGEHGHAHEQGHMPRWASDR